MSSVIAVSGRQSGHQHAVDMPGWLFDLAPPASVSHRDGLIVRYNRYAADSGAVRPAWRPGGSFLRGSRLGRRGHLREPSS